VRAGIERVAEAGATDFCAAPFGNGDDQRRTVELLSSLARG
jgi:hypothetical protein